MGDRVLPHISTNYSTNRLRRLAISRTCLSSCTSRRACWVTRRISEAASLLTSILLRLLLLVVRTAGTDPSANSSVVTKVSTSSSVASAVTTATTTVVVYVFLPTLRCLSNLTSHLQSFYDSYSQQGNFPARSGLGHDDIKSLGSQSQQQGGFQSQAGSGTPQSQGGQTGQQGYQPAPYYPYFPQNQFYGSPYGNPGYGVPQPFVKYPTMFQPGPPSGPGNASGNASKQAAGGLGSQSQSNPYAGGLYGGQQDYDNMGGYQGSQQSNLGGGLQSSDYSKQLYGGGSGQSGMQGFMGGLGSGQSTASPASAQLGQRSSPEASYKYSQTVGKDVSGTGAGSVGQPQGRSGVQQSQQGFYGGGNRFSGANPQAQPVQSQGYPQGGPDGFYSYQQGRQQQGYWQ
jgi:hypothetical protein